MKKRSVILEKRLLQYSLTSGALLAIGTPIFPQDALPKTLNTNGATCNIDLDGGGTDLWIVLDMGTPNIGFARAANSNVKFYGSNVGAYAYPYAVNSGVNVPTGGGNWFAGRNVGAYFEATFGSGSGTIGNWNGGITEKYLAVKFTGGYGWVKISMPADFSSITVHEKAFDASSVPGPLPVELTSFAATPFENTVKLLWETATEVNNYGFEVQRKEGSSQNSEFATIGFVAGHGNSNSPKSYEFIDETAPEGELEYRLKQIDTDGTFKYYGLTTKVDNTVTDIQEDNLPLEFALNQNYPNPFNPSTAISYQLSTKTDVKLSVFDLLGKEVVTLVNKEQETGKYSIDFDASNLPSGMYIYKITAGNFVESRKMLLMK